MPKKGGKPRGKTISPTASGSTAANGTPTDYDWGVALLRFKILRELENSVVRPRAVRLPRLLKREANAIYAIANEIDRKGATNVDLAKHTAAAIWDRIGTKGYDDDYIAITFVEWALARDSPHELTRSSSVIRRHAAVVEDIAERIQAVVDYYLKHATKRRRGKTGRFPSIAMDFLVETTDRWRVTRDVLAQRLLEDGSLPESERSEESDEPVEHWKMLLKQARPRSRRRGTKGG